MKAIVVRAFGGPEVLTLEEVPDPKPGPGQVLVRTGAIGVNPVDTYIRAGAYARLPDLPFSPGSDAAGTIVAVGDGVTRIAPGRRVYLLGTAGSLLHGAYAELIVCDAHQVHPLPDAVSFAQGAALGVPYATAYRALLQRARAIAGETVLVHGASGAVGIATVQLAVALGATVIGTAGSERGRRLVADQGARHVLDHSEPAHFDEIRAITGDRGLDVIVEMAAHINLARDLPLLAPRGRVIVVGNRATIEINPRDTMAKDSAILGMALWNASDAELSSIHAGLGAGLANGTLRPVVGRELPLADAPKAHEAVLESGAYGKIVLVP